MNYLGIPIVIFASVIMVLFCSVLLFSFAKKSKTHKEVAYWCFFAGTAVLFAIILILFVMAVKNYNLFDGNGHVNYERLYGIESDEENKLDSSLQSVEEYDGNGNSSQNDNMIEITNICWSGFDSSDAWLNYEGNTVTLNIRAEADVPLNLDETSNYDLRISDFDRDAQLDCTSLFRAWDIGVESECVLNLVCDLLPISDINPGYYEIRQSFQAEPDSGNFAGEIIISICVGHAGDVIYCEKIGLAGDELVLTNKGTGGSLSCDSTNLLMNYGESTEFCVWHMNHDWTEDEYESVSCNGVGSDRILDIDNAGIYEGNLVKVWEHTGYDVQYWKTVWAHIMGHGYESDIMLVNMAKDEFGEKYCLAWDANENKAVIKPVSKADEFCLWETYVVRR